MFRKPTQFLIASSLSFVVAVASAMPGMAQLRDEYTLQQAESGAVNIQLWPGSGTNLDFTSSGQFIYRAWLDDPSRVQFDTDTPIENANAQIIHLRKIDPIDFEGLPATGVTLLSVATIDGAGQRNLYQFQVSYGDSRPEYSTIALVTQAVPQTSITATIPTTSADGDVDLGTFWAGIAQLIREGTIQEDGPMHGRLKTFIALVQNGSTPVEAAQTAAINLEVVQEVAQIGLQAAADEARSRFEDDGDAALEAVDEVLEPAQRMPLEPFDAERLMESIDRVHLIVPNGE
jgi:uncharacterized protein (DUF1778 family)